MVNITDSQKSSLINNGWINVRDDIWVKNFEKDYYSKTSLDMIINPSGSKEDFYINMFVDDKYLGNGEFGISFSELIKELSFLGSIGLKFNLNNTL